MCVCVLRWTLSIGRAAAAAARWNDCVRQPPSLPLFPPAEVLVLSSFPFVLLYSACLRGFTRYTGGRSDPIYNKQIEEEEEGAGHLKRK